MAISQKWFNFHVFVAGVYFCILTLSSLSFGADCSGIKTEIENGSNYISFGPIKSYLDSYAIDSKTGRSRFNPSILRPVIGAYHLDPQKVNMQLEEISGSGQKLLSLPLWFVSIDQGEQGDGFRNHFVNSLGGRLQHQQQHNLIQLVRKIRELHFETLIIRFIPQGRNSPYEWDSFDRSLFEENMDFINTTTDLIKRELNGSSIKLLVDLGGEQGGNPKGNNPAYVRLVWKEFCMRYISCADNAYFSINPVPPNIQPRIRNLYEWIKLSEQPMPNIFAVDVYGYGGGLNRPVVEWDIYAQLTDVINELRKIGLGSSRLLIQETFYHDPKGLAEIRRFVNDSRAGLVAIVQWPNSRKVYGEYFARGVKQNWASEDYPFENYCVQ